MVLNYIWIAFFIIAFVAAFIRLCMGDTEIFPAMVRSIFDNSKTGFEISLGLTGVLTLWMGVMKIGEAGGSTRILARIFGSFFKKLFPSIPDNHPALASIIMNFSANILGLDNAATPLGLKAMEQMQTLNHDKDTASDAQIMFLTLNASGLTVLPVTIMMYRLQFGAADPSDIFIPILLATSASTFVGLFTVCFIQKINIFNRVILGWSSLFLALEIFLVVLFSRMDHESVMKISSTTANFIIFAVIAGFISLAAWRRVNVYEAFIDGAKEGFNTAIKIIPYLVAMLVAVGVFRTSGVLDVLINSFSDFIRFCGYNADFIPALPTALIKPLSGSGARGMMLETMKNYGVDSFPGRLSCIMQGAADTTFYIIALYFGSAGIKNTRYAVSVGLLAEFAGMIAAIGVAYLFF